MTTTLTTTPVTTSTAVAGTRPLWRPALVCGAVADAAIAVPVLARRLPAAR
jgi:hypothetical protein